MFAAACSGEYYVSDRKVIPGREADIIEHDMQGLS